MRTTNNIPLLATKTKQVCSQLIKRASTMSRPGPVETRIRQKLAAHFKADQIEVVNESHRHNVPENSETHFKVLVVSEDFNNLTLRHRLVNNSLREELQNGVHALSIVAKTPEQWKSGSYDLEPSPKCRGGFGK